MARLRRLVAELAGRRDPLGVRDLAILRLLHDLMLRRSEAVGLDLEHIELEAGRPTAVWIRGKGRSERERLELPPRRPTAARHGSAFAAPRPARCSCRLDRAIAPGGPIRD